VGTELSASGTFRFPSSEEDRKLSAELDLEWICETDSVSTFDVSDDPESAETAGGDDCLFFEDCSASHGWYPSSSGVEASEAASEEAGRKHLRSAEVPTCIVVSEVKATPPLNMAVKETEICSRLRHNRTHSPPVRVQSMRQPRKPANLRPWLLECLGFL